MNRPVRPLLWNDTSLTVAAPVSRGTPVLVKWAAPFIQSGRHGHTQADPVPSLRRICAAKLIALQHVWPII